MRSALSRAGGQTRNGAWRLSTKIMVSLLVLAVGAIFFFSKQSEARSTEVLTRAESRLLTSLAGSVAIQVESEVTGYRRAAVQVATDPEVVSYMTASPTLQAAGASALLNRLAPALGVDPDYRLLLIMDAAGHVVVSNQPDLQGLGFGNRAFFIGGLSAAAAEPYMSDITRSEDGHAQVMYTALPIRDALGKVLGVAAVRLSPDHVAARLTSKDLGDRHSNGVLVNQHGVILANSANPDLNYRSLGSLDPTQRELVKRELLLGSVTSLGLNDLADQVVGTRSSGFATARLLGRNETDVIGFAPVGGQGWTLLIVEAQSIFTTDVSSLARTQSLNALVLALIIGGLVIFIGRLFESTERESLSDPLTRLANRRLLQDILLRELRRANRSRLPVSLAFVDIDHFKRVNDTHGHKVGDEVLLRLAAVMLAGVRATDMVVRYGGEEFVILLPETGRDHAAQVADKLRQAVADTVIETSRTGVTLKCTISIGVAAYPIDCGSGEELILRADEALYQAKQKGRNQVALAGAEDAKAAPAAVLPAQHPAHSTPVG